MIQYSPIYSIIQTKEILSYESKKVIQHFAICFTIQTKKFYVKRAKSDPAFAVHAISSFDSFRKLII